MANWYVDSVGYTAVAQWAATHAYNVGSIVRQLAAPSVGNERCFSAATTSSVVEGKNTNTFSTASSGAVSITTAVAGDIIVLVVHAERTNAQGSYSTVSTVSGGGLAWAQRSQNQSHNGTDPYNNLEVWWAYSSGTLSAASISVTMSATVDDCSLLIFGVKNPNSTSSPWDANASLPAKTNTSAAATLSESVSTTSSGVLIMEFFANSANNTPSAGSSGSYFIGTANNSGGTNFSHAAAAAAYFGGSLSSNTISWGNSFGQSVFTVDAIPLASAPAGGTSGGSEPAWTLTAGGSTTDNTVTWVECTGQELFQHVGSTSTWTAPHARLNNTFGSGWTAAGDTVFVGDDHAETQSSTNQITPTGTNASPNFVYCADHTAAVPPGSGNLKTSATISTTGSGSIYPCYSASTVYYYGITFSAGSGSSNASIVLGPGTAITASWLKLDSCALKLNNTGSASVVQFGTNTVCEGQIELINTTINFGASGQNMFLETPAKIIWRNTASAIGGTAPTTLFANNSNTAGTIVMEGIDLSALGSGATLVGAGSASGQTGGFYFIDCKLGSSVIVASTPTSVGGMWTDLIRCSSTSSTYVQRRYWYQGTLQEETTVVRTGGASDGTTPISWKIVTTANSRWVLPFECFPISIWNSVTGSNRTVTVYGIWGGGAVPNNDDIWIEVEYLGSSGSPLASFANSTKSNNLATGSALSSDGSTWGGSTTAFKMSVTLSSPQPQLAGYLRVYVKAAKASSTFYIDPLPVLS